MLGAHELGGINQLELVPECPLGTTKNGNTKNKLEGNCLLILSSMMYTVVLLFGLPLFEAVASIGTLLECMAGYEWWCVPSWQGYSGDVDSLF